MEPGEVRLALLFSDVVDSTQANVAAGDAAMAAAWAAHDEAARALMRRWRGREIGRSDGFLVAFETVADAVGYAVAYHRSNAALAAPMRARAGMHVGPVRLRFNAPADVERGATPFEVDGLALPVAARVMSAALGGQTLLSGPAFEALDRETVAGLQVRRHGHWRFKGVPDPVELVEVGDASAPMAPPPDSAKAHRVVRDGEHWRSVRELPNTLPAERDAFVGRADALRELAACIDGGARVVTLLGIGGIGKTRLALRHARAWLGEFDGGAWFCDLAAARSADGIVHAVAQGLELPLGKADPVRQIGAALAGRGACLVILDNFEQVVPHAEATLGAWVEAAPQATFVVTSRERLGIVGEHVLPMEPLPADEAAAMFIARAAAAGQRVPYAADEAACIGPLVEMLDRLPLAIELAAARAALMSPRTLLQRMGERFQLLASRGGRRDRQATLRATLDWSWQLLSGPERAALVQLAVFEGGFTLDAAQAVLELPTDHWAPDLVQSLLEKSLLRRRGGERLDMLTTVQHYAREQGGQEPAVIAEAERRHWRHCAGWDEVQATAGRCAEADNIVAACRRAAAARDDEAAVRLLGSAWIVLRLTGPFGAAIELAQHLLKLPDLPGPLRSRVAIVVGSARTVLGQVDAARETFGAALGRLAEPDRWRGEALLAYGQLESMTGDTRRAIALLDEALALAQRHDTGSLHCRVLISLGALASETSRNDEARGHYEAALALARAAGDARREGLLQGNLGVLNHQLGRLDEAAGCYERAAQLAMSTGDKPNEGNQRCNLGLLRLEQGRLTEARAELLLASGIAAAIGHVRLQGITQCNLGLALEAEGLPVIALAAYEAALATAGADQRAEGQYRIYVGRTLLRVGRMDEARACLERAAAILDEGVGPWILCLLQCARAELAIATDQAERAQALVEQADRLLRQADAGKDSEPGREVEHARAMLRAVTAAQVSRG